VRHAHAAQAERGFFLGQLGPVGTFSPPRSSVRIVAEYGATASMISA
jgi:hypothetical protein